MKNNSSQAPFSLLTKFLRDIARVKIVPGYVFESSQDSSSKQNSRGPGRNVEKQNHASSRKTSIDQNSDSRAEENPNKDKSGTPAECPMHGSNLNSFKFLRMSVKRRKDFLFKNGYCLRCCGPKRHLRKHCRAAVSCDTCNSSDHVTILHPEAARDDEGEKGHRTEVKSNCTEVCNTNQNTSKSCAKIILVKVFQD